MSIHLLLISREEREHFAFTRLNLVLAPTPQLDAATLGWIIDCPPEELEFTRVGPIELAHGGAWARARHLDSLRWPFLEEPLIRGRAVGIRIGARWPGEAASQPVLPARALTEWEGRNALRCFRDYMLPLGLKQCPVDEAFQNSLSFPLYAQFEAADAAGRLAIRREVTAKRKAQWAVIHAEIKAERLARELAELEAHSTRR